MKKKLYLLPFLLFLTTSCAIISEDDSPIDEKETVLNPEEVDQEGMSIYPKHSRGRGCVGDPMPYYENGKYYVYYLEDARNYRLGYHPIALFETTDFVHYDEKGIVLNFVSDITSPEMALATGSVIKDKDGLYHFFYGGHNSSRSSNLPYWQIVEHATSTDLLNWEKHPEYGFYGECNDFRDPYVLYMESEQQYWLLVFSRIDGHSAIMKYTSKDLWNWKQEAPFYESTVFNSMECPSLIYYKGYWYYSFSENGNHGYTYFMYKKNLSDPEWKTPKNFIDGLFAGRPVIGKDNRLFICGWCPTKSGYDSSNPDWAGNLVTLELEQNENGELSPIMPKEIKEALNTEVTYKALRTETQLKSVSFTAQSNLQSVAFHELNTKKIVRMTFDYTPKSDAGHAGLTMGCQGENELGFAAFDINLVKGQIAFHNDCKYSALGLVEYGATIGFEVGTTYHFELVYEDGVSILYLDNKAALSMRTISFSKGLFAFYAQNNECEFSNINFYE